MAEMYAKIKESLWEALKKVSDEERHQFLDAYIEYTLTGEEPELSGIAEVLFLAVKSEADDHAKSVSGGSQGGSKTPSEGGSARGVTKAPSEAPLDQEDREERTKEETEENIKEKPPKGGKEKRRFAPPSLQDVQDYKTSRGDKGENVDPETFIDFYESKGWKVGNQPMKDWKAAFRTWEKREKPVSRSGTSKITPWNQFPQREYDDDALEKLLIESM